MATTSSGVRLPEPADLPPGPQRELAEALYDLYRAAGRPGLRRIADAVTRDDRFRDTISHQKVSAMLRGDGVPKWSKFEPVVRVLADWSTPRRNPAAEAGRFKALWDAATGTEASVPVEPHTGRLRSAFVLGGVTGETAYPSFEEAELERFCHRLGESVARSGADLVVCSPFPNTADFHALRGYLAIEGDGLVQLHSPRYPSVVDQTVQLRALLGAEAAARIRIWHYPGPETADPDSLAQSWLLCQLRAAEHADVLLAVGGRVNGTANTILHLAEIRQQPILPFTFLGGAANRAFARRDWGRACPGLDVRKLTEPNWAADAMAMADQLVTARLGTADSPSELGRPAAVFLSRAGTDVRFAEALLPELSSAGLAVTFDDTEPPSSRTVESAIEDAVLRADLFIALWSRAYAASRYCFDELQLALNRRRAGELRLWLINLDGSDVVPPGARDLPQVHARTPAAVVAVITELLAGPY